VNVPKRLKAVDWPIFAVRVCIALIGGCVLSIAAAFCGALIAPDAHGLPVVITGLVSGAIGFLAVWFYDPLENW
jgi:hypothetical protein